MVVWRLPYALAQSMQQAATKIAAAAAAAGVAAAGMDEATSAAESQPLAAVASAVVGPAVAQSTGFVSPVVCESPPVGSAHGAADALQGRVQPLLGGEIPQGVTVRQAWHTPAAAAAAGLLSTPGSGERPENDVYVSPKLDPVMAIWQEAASDTSLTGGLALFAQRVRQGRPLLSVSRLPKWAQCSPGNESQEGVLNTEGSGFSGPVLRQNSRWAKNLEEEFCVHNEKGEPLVLKVGEGK
jgi:hypothetical protein